MRCNARSSMAAVLIAVMVFSPAIAYAQASSGAIAKPAAGQMPTRQQAVTPPQAPLTPGARAAAAAPATPSAQQPQSQTRMTLGYLTPETAVLVVAYPRRVLTAPEMEMLPIEVIAAAGRQELGIDPTHVEQAIVLVEPPRALAPRIAIVLKMAAPLGPEQILPSLWDHTLDDKLEGVPYRRAEAPTYLSIFRPDDRTLLIASDDLLRKLLSNRGHRQEGAMSRIVGSITDPPDLLAVMLVEPIRAQWKMGLALAPLPPQMSDLKKIPDLSSLLVMQANLKGQAFASWTLRAQDAAAAQKIEEIYDRWLVEARQAILAEISKGSQSGDPVEQALSQYARRLADRMLQWMRPVRTGDTLSLSSGVAGGAGKQLTVSQVALPLLGALMLPAVQAARQAARRTVSLNNLRQIGLAMHRHHDSTHRFPARAIFDKQGNPLLSWRVALLPFLEEGKLYEEFHLDEPWDSAHNRPLIAKIPKVFQSPSRTAAQGTANYLAVCGEGLAFEGTKGRQVADFAGGLSDAILVVEADDDHAVPWTKPEDWQYDARNPLAGLGHAHPGGFNALFADGHVQLLPDRIDPRYLRAMLTIAGGRAGSDPGPGIDTNRQDAAARAAAHNSSGIALAKEGKDKEAMEHFQQALQLQPDAAAPRRNMGLVLARAGKQEEAIAQFREALRLDPGAAEVHIDLGASLAMTGKTAQAIDQYQEALRLKPDSAQAHHNLGLALASLRQHNAAIDHLREALQLSPDSAEIHNSLALALAGSNRNDEAIEHYRQALQLRPTYADAHHNLGNVLEVTGKTQEAMDHYVEALRLNPNSLRTHYSLAGLLVKAGKTKEAVEHYNECLRLQPDFGLALNDLAWLLAARDPSAGGDPARAVQLAERARDLVRGNSPACLDTLAAAYAAAGNFNSAVATAAQAVQLAQSARQPALAKRIASRLELYRAGQPYREPAK